MEFKNINELETFIKKNNSGYPILISGIEKSLIKQSINIIYKTIDVLPELNIVTLEGDFINYDEVVNACEALPVISNRKVVHIKNPLFLKKSSSNNDSNENKANNINNLSKYLTEFIKNVPADTIILLSLNDEADSKSKIVSLIKSSGYSLEFKNLKGEELNTYVNNLFEKNNKKINKSDLLYFISTVSGSFDVMEREVEKVCSYGLGDEYITKKHIDDIVHKGIENNIFKMVDSISIKNTDTAISILNALLFQKEDPLRILGMIIRQYRILYLILIMLNANYNTDQIKSELKAQKIILMDFVINNFMKQARSFDQNSLKRALSYCAKADFDIKNSGSTDDLILETLIVKLSS